MAIKVNGTTVINDSRALSNIASVDATTVAAMSAAGVGGYLNRTINYVFAESGTFIAPISGKMVVQVVGGGGGGGNARIQNPNTYSDAAGGAAGGYSLKTVTVTAGDTYTVTAGARGARGSTAYVAGSSPVSLQSGGNGGTTTVTGPSSFSISATGGGGGGTATGGAASQTASSGAGGSGSGGTVNTTGGTSSTSGVTREVSGWMRASFGASISIVQGTTGANASNEMSFTGGNFQPDGTTSSSSWSNNEIISSLVTRGETPYVLTPVKFDTSAISTAGAATWNYGTYNGGAQAVWGEFGGGGGACVSKEGQNYQRVQWSGNGGAGAAIFAIFTDDVSA